MGQALILGGGFTGRRVAARLRARGWKVVTTSRSGDSGLRLDVNDPKSLDAMRKVITPQTVVLHSIPVPGVMETLLETAPARLVYLSTTGVYGPTQVVDETTPVDPRTARESLRVAEENAVLAGAWKSIVLRPAAIYGPGRGIHSAMQAGTYKLMGSGANFVSRIHVDDLAAHAEAAMLSDVAGAYPVADEYPCTSREIAEYCANLLGLPMPEEVSAEQLGETRRADRRVNGSAILRLLGLNLRYPSYREGIPACLAAETRAFS